MLGVTEELRVFYFSCFVEQSHGNYHTFYLQIYS